MCEVIVVGQSELYCPVSVVAPCKEGVGGLATEKLARLLSWATEGPHTYKYLLCYSEVILRL